MDICCVLTYQLSTYAVNTNEKLAPQRDKIFLVEIFVSIEVAVSGKMIRDDPTQLDKK